MLKIKTKIGVSKTHGIGLFAGEDIKKGTVTWQYNPDFDLTYDEASLKTLSDISQATMLHYSYFDKNLRKYVIPIDDLRFINHTEDAEKANIESTPTQDIASRDIQEGEELFCNYNKFDDEYFDRIGIPKDQIL